MKRTKIHYNVTIDGKILIAGFENVASRQNIKEKFGVEVLRIYEGNTPRYMIGGVGEFRVYIDPNSPDDWMCDVMKGDIFSKEYFDKMIAAMRAAGSRLKNIHEAVRDYETKTIVI